LLRALPLLLLVSGCAQLAAFREPFVAPGNALNVAWRRQITETQLFGGFDNYVRDGKDLRMSAGLELGYKPQEFAGVASDGDRVFVGSSHGMLWALSALDGRLLWRRPLGGPISSQPAYLEELKLVVVGDDQGALWAIEPDTGRERWVAHTHAPITAQPIYAEGNVYFTTSENRVYAVDAVTGKWKWQYDREAPDGFTIRGQSGVLYSKGRVYTGFADGYLASLEARTGDVVWVKSLAGDAISHYVDVDSTPTIEDGVMYASSVSGGVYALDPKDGSVHWRYEVDAASSVRVHGDRLYFAAGKAGLHCLDLAGHLVWKQVLPSAGELSTPLIVDAFGKSWVVLGAATSGAYIADAQTGRLEQFLAPGEGISGTPSSDAHNVYLVSNLGFLWALGLEGGRRSQVAVRQRVETLN
jgi:outer membrane protein assembly factor BamB